MKIKHDDGDTYHIEQSKICRVDLYHSSRDNVSIFIDGMDECYTLTKNEIACISTIVDYFEDFCGNKLHWVKIKSHPGVSSYIRMGSIVVLNEDPTCDYYSISFGGLNQLNLELNDEDHMEGIKAIKEWFKQFNTAIVSMP